MRSAPRRFPVAETAFILVLLAGAFVISWLSGRTLVLTELFSPVQSAVQAVTNAFSGGVERVQNLKTLQEENDRLKRRIDDLEQTLDGRDEQGRENERLRDLLKLQVPPAAQPLIVARVVGRNPDNWYQRVIIDKGSDQGLKVDSAVADRRGLIGRVITVSPHTAMVTLVTDPTFGVSVLNTRTRSAGVIMGQGDQWPTLRYLDQPEKWKVGDRLITSGLGGTFPKGLSIGKIVKIRSASDMFYPELRVQPNVPLDKIEEALVLPPGMPEMPIPTPKPTPTPGVGGTDPNSPKQSPPPSAKPSAKPH
ncbi:MAG: rod shape-determining protein MreC [Cyanobacteria bacterium RYN_339]|nr:rod shape-determining protein MreC [Cyanobacteria bacterium RYN_339]